VIRFIRALVASAVLAGTFAAGALALAFDDQSYIWPVGKVGVPYAKQLGTRGDCPPFKYTIDGGNLPPGISLSIDGLASGTPTKDGTFSFWVRLRDCLNMSSEREFTVVIEPNAIAPLEVTTGSLKVGVVGQGYSAPLSASGGSGAQTWSASGLPAGLAVTGNTITGKPTAAGDFTVTVTVTNGGSSKSKQLQLKIVQPLNLNADLPRAAEVGRPFSATIAATGGLPAYKWSVGALPAGLSFDSAKGVLSGVPTAAGDYAVKVALSDAAGYGTESELRFKVFPRLALVTRNLKSAKVGRAFAARLLVSGGVTPLKWKLLSGKLPRGVRLDTSAGKVVGTPRAPGTFRVRVGVTDALGATSVRAFILRVHA
jgi:hypothetical protein